MDHALHFLIRETVGGLHLDRLGFTGANIARRHTENAVGVDHKGHLDTGHTGGQGGNL